MGNIYESLAVLILQQIAGAVGGHGTFYHHPLKRTDRHDDSSLLGPVGIFWAYLTPRCSEMSGFLFYSGFQKQHKAIVLGTFMGIRCTTDKPRPPSHDSTGFTTRIESYHAP